MFTSCPAMNLFDWEEYGGVKFKKAFGLIASALLSHFSQASTPD